MQLQLGKCIVLFLFAFCLNVNIVFGQELNEYYCLVDSLTNRCNKQYRNKKYDDSLLNIDSIISLHEINNNVGIDLALINYTKGYTLIALKNYTEAEKALLKAIEIYAKEEPSSVYNYSSYTQLANVYRLKFDYEKAKNCYVKAIDLNLQYFDPKKNNQLKRVVVYANSLVKIGYTELSHTKLDEILLKFQEYDLKTHMALFNLYSTRGIHEKNKGNYEAALENYKLAERILIYHNQEESPSAARLHVNYGVLNKNKANYLQAIKDYEKSLEIGKKVFSKQPFRNATVLTNLAQIHSRLEHKEKALSYIKESLRLNRERYGEASINYLTTYLFNEEVLYSLNMKSKLIDEADYIDSLYRLAYKDLDFVYLKYKSAVYKKAKMYEEADLNINLAIKKYNDGLGSMLQTNFRDPINLYAQKGDIHYIDANGDVEILKKSAEAYSFVVELIANTKKQIDLTSSATSHINSLNFILRDATIVFQDLYNLTQDADFLNEVLKISSLVKNVDLEIKFSGAKALEFAKVSDQDIQKIKEIKDEIDLIETNLSELSSRSDSMFVEYFDEMKIAEGKKMRWLENIEKKYPEYYSFKHGFWDKSFQELLDEKIKHDELFIDYVQFDSVFYVTSISKNNSFSRAIKMDSSFLAQLSIVKFKDSFETLSETKINLSELHEILIAKELEVHGSGIKNITISPDAELSTFPFEMLYKDDHIVTQYSIKYIHAIDFKYLNGGQSKKAFAAFAPQYEELKLEDVSDTEPMAMLVRDGEWILPGAQKEVDQISKLLEGETFVNKEATVNNFINEGPKYKVLHMSMHTLPNDSLKQSYALAFQNDALHSKFELLSDDKISELDLNAELVVLSACNTGKGKYKKGLGVKSLANSFFYSGIPSTIMSYWKVPDEQTSEIMISFYKYLKLGESKSVALKHAKVDYLKNVQVESLKHPYFWAGFVLIGNDEPIDFSTNSPFLIYFALTTLLLIVIFALIKFWKK